MNPRPLPVLVLSLLAAHASAQISAPGRPASFSPEFDSDVPVVVMPSPDVAAMMAEDAARENGPFRYGAVIQTSIGCQESGRWDQAATGELVWRVRIASPGAYSLSVVFSEFEIPHGGQVFLYDPARKVVLGAYTEKNHQANGMLAVQPIAGDEFWIEYVQGFDVSAEPRLRVGEVVHDYRGVFSTDGPGLPLTAEFCLFDINCPVGAPYQDIKRAVFQVFMGGGQCSAGLLNNTAQDGTPYFLTANHCGNMTNVFAIFDYERSGCEAGSSSQSRVISGATLLADNVNYDSQLYVLSSPPPTTYKPFYAGWDRRIIPQPEPAISISHPAGLPKKIALDSQGPEANGTNWTTAWTMGRLEGGSSGSPLFNGEQRVLGPACCVSSFLCGNQWATYGRFGAFFNARDLAQWLDPIGDGSLVILDGYDPFRPYATIFNGSRVNPNVYVSTSPPGIGTTWTASIDVSGHPGATSTWIFGHAASIPGQNVPFGELLLDLGSPRHFISSAGVSSGVSTHSNAIPNNPLLAGTHTFTQALILGGGNRVLTNGVALVIK